MADLEQERVTALWREAATTLAEPSLDEIHDSDKWWPAGLPEWVGAQTNETLRALDKGLRSFGWPAYNVPKPLPREDSWPGIALGLAQLIRDSEAECGRLREQLDAARQALEQISALGWADMSWRLLFITCQRLARAALGVVGEQEKTQ